MMEPGQLLPNAPMLRLGLIGDNIQDSRSPDLHRLAGLLCGLDVRYELIVPADRGQTFDEAFETCHRNGLSGVNVTYPYKERVTGRLAFNSLEVTRVSSCNTVVFTPEGPVGHNTDYLGFIAAYHDHFDGRAAGRVAIVGAGGVGRAIAFALAELGASELRLIDSDADRAVNLGTALRGLPSAPAIRIVADIETALSGVDGVVNCTPVGMFGKPGSAVPRHLLRDQRWAFDAVYTPVETEFLRAARDAGMDTLSGYELFFQQGIKAFELFTGRVPPLVALRRQLAGPQQHKEAS